MVFYSLLSAESLTTRALLYRRNAETVFPGPVSPIGLCYSVYRHCMITRLRRPLSLSHVDLGKIDGGHLNPEQSCAAQSSMIVFSLCQLKAQHQFLLSPLSAFFFSPVSELGAFLMEPLKNAEFESL